MKTCIMISPPGAKFEREDLRPAPYVGRYKWVMADRLDALGADSEQPYLTSRRLVEAHFQQVKLANDVAHIF